MVNIKRQARVKENPAQANDPEVILFAPAWVEERLKALSSKFTHVTFQGKTLTLPLTLRMLSAIARNEQYNVTGVIDEGLYGGLDKKTIIELRDLVRQCVMIGKDVATHQGGYPLPHNPLEKKKTKRAVYLIDLAALQFQDLNNTGRLVIIGDPKKAPLIDADNDALFQRVVGESKASFEEACKNPERYIGLSFQNSKTFFEPANQDWLDTLAYRRFVMQDFMLSAIALNQAAEINNDQVNFKFLKYGTGFFAEGLMYGGKTDAEKAALLQQAQSALKDALSSNPSLSEKDKIKIYNKPFRAETAKILEYHLALAVKEGLECLRATPLGQIKRIELPFFDKVDPASATGQVIQQIQLICQESGLSFGCESQDAFAELSQSVCEDLIAQGIDANALMTATTTCADPHAPAGNEMNYQSVDAMLAENTEKKANHFIAANNTVMQERYITLPRAMKENVKYYTPQHHQERKNRRHKKAGHTMDARIIPILRKQVKGW